MPGLIDRGDESKFSDFACVQIESGPIDRQQTSSVDLIYKTNQSNNNIATNTSLTHETPANESGHALCQRCWTPDFVP